MVQFQYTECYQSEVIVIILILLVDLACLGDVTDGLHHPGMSFVFLETQFGKSGEMLRMSDARTQSSAVGLLFCSHRHTVNMAVGSLHQ